MDVTIVDSDASTWESSNDNLLQKMVQLQVELLKRDSEVALLKKAIASNLNSNNMLNKHNASIDSPHNLRGSLRSVSVNILT